MITRTVDRQRSFKVQMDNNDDHRRTIVHIDIDCFYAQVEMNKNPELRTKPLGIQQKNIVVTSNYVAREFGIKKCMFVEEALKLCPKLVLVKGEDLRDYRQASYKVTAHLQQYSPLVERLGLDENFVDVTNLVNDKLRQYNKSSFTGNVFGDDCHKCLCGCMERLHVASHIAHEMRASLRDELNLTTCAGIAHNKLLAKLVCAVNKPNQQTMVYPESAVELLLHQNLVNNVPGIGRTTAEILNNLRITTVEDLQRCEVEVLKTSFGSDKGTQLKDLSFGRDLSAVKPTGRPQSIGLEDSCRSITLETEIRDKLHQLLHRLMMLVQDDGRIPKSIKLTVRKYDNHLKFSHRESRQVNINPKLFAHKELAKLSEASEEKVMATIMHLFSKLVDVQKPYHITLLGLSFTKFVERAIGKSSITNFLKKNVEVQSLTSIENKSDHATEMDYSYSSSNSNEKDFNTDGSESDFEPSPKKTKLTSLMMKKRCFNLTDTDCPSPSKLKVAELRLNSKEVDGSLDRDRDDQEPQRADNNHNVKCPPDVDCDVFKQLPMDVRQELWDDYKRQLGPSIRSIKKPKINTLLNYFLKQ